MKLIYEKNGQTVKIGDRVLTAGSSNVTITGITPPHKPSSTGRVTVMAEDSHGRPSYSEYFPGVIDAKWIDRKDQDTLHEYFEDRHVLYTYEMHDDSLI